MTLMDPRIPASSCLARPGLLSLLVLVAACGSEEGVSPKTGLYHYEVAMLENTCGPLFDDDGKGEEVVEVVDDTIRVPMSQVLSYEAPTCEGCVPSTSWRTWTTQLDPENGLYIAALEWGSEPGSCLHERVELEVLDDRTLQGRITVEVARDEACPWKDTVVADCVVAREYTYTLVED